MIYAYVRVSTYYQLKGNSIDNQKEEILERYPDAQIYVESESGKSMDRPVYQGAGTESRGRGIPERPQGVRICRESPLM